MANKKLINTRKLLQIVAAHDSFCNPELNPEILWGISEEEANTANISHATTAASLFTHGTTGRPARHFIGLI